MMKTFCYIFAIFLAIQLNCRTAFATDSADHEKNELFSVHQNGSIVEPEDFQQKNSTEENVERKSVSQKLLETRSDLRDFITNKVSDIYDILKELEKSSDTQKILTMNVDRVPNFTGPFYIGKFNKTYKLADMQYRNIRVYGMSNFKDYVMTVDNVNRKANITLVANELRIEGNYSLSNFLKHTSGAFVVKLINNVTYNERDIYCRFKDDVDIAAAEATITYGKSESKYENIGLLAHLFEGVISNKLTEEILYRIGREVGHKIRHVTTSKIRKASSNVIQPAEYNRIVAIVKSTLSEIRTSLDKTGSVSVHFPNIHHQIKIQNSFALHMSNVSLQGLNTMHLTKEVKTDLDKDDFRITLQGEAGPFVISAQVLVTADQDSKPVSLTVGVEYQVSAAQVKIAISNSLYNDDSSFEVTDLEVTISQPDLKMKSDKLKIPDDQLQQLAQLVKPDIEMELYRWLKDFVNDIFHRTKPSSLMEIETIESTAQFYA